MAQSFSLGGGGAPRPLLCGPRNPQDVLHGVPTGSPVHCVRFQLLW